MWSIQKVAGPKHIQGRCGTTIFRSIKRLSTDGQTGTCSITQTYGTVEAKFFREVAIKPERPLILRVGKDKVLPAADTAPGLGLRDWKRPGDLPAYLPALDKWFQRDSDAPGKAGFTRFLTAYSDAEVPYELTLAPGDVVSFKKFLTWLSNTQQTTTRALAEYLKIQLDAVTGPETQFVGFNAPLELILGAAKYNQEFAGADPVTQLYVAQLPLGDLPSALQADLPVPELVKKGGKGDVYSSSLWIGLQPTYTPWHRDPNPNLFVQLQGSKTVKMLPPARGLKLFREVKTSLGFFDSASIRTEEMMRGHVREAFWEMVWGNDVADDFSTAVVHPGDALYIPKGWWHSVMSEPDAGALNVSVNWWFR